MDFTIEFLIENLAKYQIPPYMHDGIIAWIRRGSKPGGFLTALIENDLRETFLRADDNNIHRINQYLSFFYNAAPAGCWGSKNKVFEWQTMGGLRKFILDDKDGE